jgi:hypothetical protein
MGVLNSTFMVNEFTPSGNRGPIEEHQETLGHVTLYVYNGWAT